MTTLLMTGTIAPPGAAPGLADDAGGPVFKITGRYVIRNAAAILGRVGSTFDLALHCRDYPTRFVDFGMAGFRASRALDFLGRVLGRRGVEKTDERVLRSMMDDGSFESLDVLPRLARVPDFRGPRGSDGESYGAPKYRMKYLLRAVAQRAMPRLRI